jgi:predicted lipoprotein with Yx(FWY)xxD motif
MMHPRLFLTGGLVAAALTAVACGTADRYAAAPSPTSTYPPTLAPVASSPSPITSPRASGKTISAANSRLGQILVGPTGRTFYLFLADSGTTSNCNSASCVQACPPVLTTGAPQAGAGVSASLLGTTTRRDGSTEVTYAGHPVILRLGRDAGRGQRSGHQRLRCALVRRLAIWQTDQLRKVAAQQAAGRVRHHVAGGSALTFHRRLPWALQYEADTD